MLDSYFQTCENSRTSRTKCSFWRFKGSRWEVIFAFRVAGAYFRGVSRSACCFCVAGAELSAHAFWSCVAGAAFCDVSKMLFLIFFNESECQGSANVTQCQKSWQAQHFVTALKSCGSLAKSDTFGAL